MTTETCPYGRDGETFRFGEVKGLELDPRYAALRDECPVARITPPHGEDAWLLTRHDDVREVLADPRFSRITPEGHDEARVAPMPIGTSIMGLDEPDHGRIRKLVAGSFSSRAVARLRPRARQVAEELLDEMVAAGSPADLMAAFTTPFSGIVTCELLGVPFDDRGRFQDWMQAFFGRSGLPQEEVRAQLGLLNDYLTELVRARRGQEGGDLITAVVRAADEEGTCTEAEVVELVYTLLIGGYETPGSQLASSLFVLLQHPEQADLLRHRPELMPRAVEELLRFVPLIAYTGFARYATEDVTVRGVTVRAGEAVLPGIPAANRDPEVFPAPEEFDITRGDNPHLSFGHGTHFCTGAALARMELQEALSALLVRFPKLRIAGDAERLGWAPGTQIRSLVELPVAW
ncbi:cytochrome P450 [Amycolatopsis sp. NPDC049252]|uniref:cytochrome P450 n=1 Tax=Amycolatopsis sp. NPDC049252 TaxID=3363933 RepID=UPI003721DBC6